MSTDIQYTDALVFGDHTFLSCAKLYKIEAPSCLTAFGNSVFAGCKSLSSVTLPSGLRKFGTKVFAGCPALTAANTYNKTEFKYRLGRDYDITIQLSGSSEDYKSDDSSPDKNKIFEEIKGLVGCLQTEKVGQTATNKTLASRAGRRFNISYTNGGSGLEFNSIYASANKIGVFTIENIIASN